MSVIVVNFVQRFNGTHLRCLQVGECLQSLLMSAPDYLLDVWDLSSFRHEHSSVCFSVLIQAKSYATVCDEGMATREAPKRLGVAYAGILQLTSFVYRTCMVCQD